jgi:hypothetical protein
MFYKSRSAKATTALFQGPHQIKLYISFASLGFAVHVEVVSLLSTKLKRKQAMTFLPNVPFQYKFGDDCPHISILISHPFVAELQRHSGIGGLRN